MKESHFCSSGWTRPKNDTENYFKTFFFAFIPLPILISNIKWIKTAISQSTLSPHKNISNVYSWKYKPLDTSTHFKIQHMYITNFTHSLPEKSRPGIHKVMHKQNSTTDKSIQPHLCISSHFNIQVSFVQSGDEWQAVCPRHANQPSGVPTP